MNSVRELLALIVNKFLARSAVYIYNLLRKKKKKSYAHYTEKVHIKSGKQKKTPKLLIKALDVLFG